MSKSSDHGLIKFKYPLIRIILKLAIQCFIPCSKSAYSVSYILICIGIGLCLQMVIQAELESLSEHHNCEQTINYEGGLQMTKCIVVLVMKMAVEFIHYLVHI